MTDQTVRRGLTLEYAQEKQQKLLEELRSDEHYDQTDTVAYGHHDPFSVPVTACENCGGYGQMRKVEQKAIRWVVVCLGCGKQAKAPQKRPWQAALEWNQINLGGQDYRDLPLFGLSKLEAYLKWSMLALRLIKVAEKR